jgi:hypothetical protein
MICLWSFSQAGRVTGTAITTFAFHTGFLRSSSPCTSCLVLPRLAALDLCSYLLQKLAQVKEVSFKTNTSLSPQSILGPVPFSKVASRLDNLLGAETYRGVLGGDIHRLLPPIPDPPKPTLPPFVLNVSLNSDHGLRGRGVLH